MLDIIGHCLGILASILVVIEFTVLRRHRDTGGKKRSRRKRR
jgi:hypothetical protein